MKDFLIRLLDAPAAHWSGCGGPDTLLFGSNNEAVALLAGALKRGGPFLPFDFYILLMIALIVGITVHEYGHAWMADRLGDTTPREEGRVTLSPLAHLDPLGTLIMAVTALVGLPVGWGKPVRTDPDTYNIGRRKGIGYVAAAGPAMNLVCAVVLAPIARWFMAGNVGGPVSLFLFALVVITMLVNLSLLCFNLLPLYPLDGSHIASSLLPENLSGSYQRFMARYGVYVFLLLMFTGTLGKFVGPLVVALFRFLLGI